MKRITVLQLAVRTGAGNHPRPRSFPPLPRPTPLPQRLPQPLPDTKAADAPRVVLLTRTAGERGLPWGLRIDSTTMQLMGRRDASVAARSDGISRCMGMVLTAVDGVCHKPRLPRTPRHLTSTVMPQSTRARSPWQRGDASCDY